MSMHKTTIPVIEARGTPYQVGFQIGVAARDSMRTMHAETRAEYGDKWQALLQQSIPFVEATRQHLPRVMEEMRGVAEGSGIPFDDLFLMSVEELLYEEVRGTTSPPAPLLVGEGRGATSPPTPLLRKEGGSLLPSPTGRRAGDEGHKGCSDLAAAPPATRDGHVWLAHNNDLGPGARTHLFVTKLRVEGAPEVLAVTVGGWFISIGMNSAGLALTGNQLSANDSRAGIPRLLIVREILAQTARDDALAVALHPARASSYNNIIAARDARIVNVEGSATAAALTWSDQVGGALAHTNHYLDATMRRYEADTASLAMSASRCARALDYVQKYRGKIDFEICARFVRDHVYAPWSVCKHAGQSVTVFSAIIDLTAGKMWLASGNPCQNHFESHTCAQNVQGPI
jgi:isopenicillin-N N-acyltransferase-like protein